MNTTVHPAEAINPQAAVSEFETPWFPASWKFWPLPLIRVYPTGDGLSELFLAFAAAKDLTQQSTEFSITIKCSLGTITCWNANKWYAWANDGAFINAAGLKQCWMGEMPSRHAVRAIRRALIGRRFVFAGAQQ